jgi:NADPH2 dehydrogenase
MYAGFREESAEFDSTLDVIERLATVDVDYIDLSAGFYTVDRTLIYPVGSKTSRSELPYYRAASAIARRIAKPVVFAGNLRDVRALPSDMPENLMVAAARAFIADPTFAEKSARGRYDEVVACDRKNACHYFTRGKAHITCGVNPQLGGSTYEY